MFIDLDTTRFSAYRLNTPFYDLIIPTYHPHSLAINCAIQLDSQQCPEFGKNCRIRNAREFAKSNFVQTSNFTTLSMNGQFPGFRIDERFLATWLGPDSQSSLATDTSLTFQNLSKFWNGFTGCQAIVLHEGLSGEGAHQSDRLHTSRAICRKLSRH